MRKFNDSEKEHLFELIRIIKISLDYILQNKDIYESSYIIKFIFIFKYII